MPPGAADRRISRTRLIAVVASAGLALGGCGVANRPTRPAHAHQVGRPIPAAGCAHEPLADVPLPEEVGVYRAGPLTLVLGTDLAQDAGPAPGRRTSGSEAIIVRRGGDRVVLSVDRRSRGRFSLQFTPNGSGSVQPTVSDGHTAVVFPACSGHTRRFGGGVLFRGTDCIGLHVKQPGRRPIPMLVPIGDTLRGCPASNPRRSLGSGATPFLGVSCRVPNSIACERLGVGVHLSARVTLVVVRVAGWLVTLSPPTDRGADLWQGYLDDAGLRHGSLAVRTAPRSELWFGTPEVDPRVRVTAFFPDGHAASLATTVLLHPGFG